MIQDTAVPPAILPSSVTAMEARGVGYSATRWSPADLERLMDSLAEVGAQALNRLEPGETREAWAETVASSIMG